jgi:hypothetical protein
LSVPATATALTVDARENGGAPGWKVAARSVPLQEVVWMTPVWLRLATQPDRQSMHAAAISSQQKVFEVLL